MRYLTFVLMLFAPPALANDFTCTFTQECIEGEACAETNVTVVVENNGEQGGGMTLRTDTEVLGGIGMQRDGPAHAVFPGDTAMHVISASSDASARYTIHMTGPIAITYQGTCEGFE